MNTQRRERTPPSRTRGTPAGPDGGSYCCAPPRCTSRAMPRRVRLLDEMPQRIGPGRHPAPFVHVKAQRRCASAPPSGRPHPARVAEPTNPERPFPHRAGEIPIPLLPLLADVDRVQQIRRPAARRVHSPPCFRCLGLAQHELPERFRRLGLGQQGSPERFRRLGLGQHGSPERFRRLGLVHHGLPERFRCLGLAHMGPAERFRPGVRR